MGRYRCSVCNWVYDPEKEGKDFEDLPDDFTCPICGAPKSAFVAERLVRDEGEAADTVADKIVDQLVALGVDCIYGIPGDSNLPLIDAIRRDARIRFVLTRHEETAAFMASAHGKMTDRLGVCVSIAGPGCTNLITGLMDASADRSPVLALLGQIPEVFLGSEAFQEIDELELFHPFTQFAETVARPSQALKLTLVAAKYAQKTPGVAALSLPTDVLTEKLGDHVFAPDKRLFRLSVHPRHEEVRRAVRLLNQNKRVVILAGWGARHAGGLLIQLAEKLNAAIATTSRAKGIINETSERSLGVLGSIGSKHAALAAQAADLVLVVGTGFRHANLIPSAVKLIQVDTDPTRIGRTFDVDVGILGDASAVLARLIEKVEGKDADAEFWSSIARLKAAHLQEVEADVSDLSRPVNPGYVIQCLRRQIARDAIICVDVGDHTYWFYKKFLCEGQRTYLSANIASMGFGLPAALSAKLDYPDRQVVCLTGDGGFGMLAADFTTAVRENLGITVIVFNDGKLKNIKKEQERDGYPEFGVDFPNPDFAQFAASCGGEGYRVENPSELDGVLRKALTSGRPTIVDVLVDPRRMAVSGKKLD
jgi:thiamine pyrophosphate-dependent acetolactate synthase large subunit-like protein/rubredoxin